MDRETFLSELRDRLAGLSPEDREERLTFYREMIDDRMEDGLSETEAVAGIGSVDDVVAQIAAETPLMRLVKERVRPKKSRKAWEIVLLVLGSPVWFPLLIAAFAVLLALYLVLWAVVLSLWAAALSLAVGAVGCLPLAVLYFVRGLPAGGCFILGAGLVLAGLAIPLGAGCAGLTKGLARLTGRLLLGLKTRFVRKEAAV